jgi:uncharacterized protein (TIGR03437 family)
MSVLYISAITLVVTVQSTLAQTPLSAVNAFSNDNRLSAGCLAMVTGGNLPTSALAGATVGDEPATILQASTAQWLIQIPLDLLPGPTTIQIGSAPAISAVLTQYAPALESANLSGTGLIAALHGQPTPVLVSPSSTAKLGEFLEIYATGLGPSNPDGSVSGTVLLSVAGTPIPIISAILSTSVPGVYVVDLQLPGNLPTGNDAVVLSIAGLTSNRVMLPVASAFTLVSAQGLLSKVASLSIPNNVRAVAVNGQYAYACTSASIAVVDFSSLSQPTIVATFAQTDLVNADYMTCNVVQDELFVTADTSDSNTQGTTGQLLVYDLTNPANPQRITSFAAGKRYISGQVVVGNTLFLPTVSVWSNGPYKGDLIAEDISNISQPVTIATLFQASPGWDATYGGAQLVTAAVSMDQPFIVASSSTAKSWPTSTSDTGMLFSVDVSNPKQMNIAGTLRIPGSKIMETVVRDGNLVLGVGDTAEWEYVLTPQHSVLVLADYGDPSNPVLLSNQATQFTTVGVGPRFGAIALGQRQFVVAGQSFNGLACLLVVNAADPSTPVLTPVYVPYPVISLARSGSILVTGEQTNGIGFYQIAPTAFLTPPLSAEAASVGASASGGGVQVNAAPGSAWSAFSNAAWITITSSASGTGSGSLTFTISANSGVARSGSINIGGQTFTVYQESGLASGLSFAGSMAQVASAGGWDTSLTVVNLGSTPGEARLNFFGDNGGTPWLPFTYTQQPAAGTTVGATFDQTLAAGASFLLDTTGPLSQTNAEGWSQLMTSGDINGFAIFTYTPNGQAATVPLETRNAASYQLAFDDTGAVSTGLALANLAASAAKVNVVIRSDTGAQLGKGSIQLPAQGHTSFMLTDPTYGFPVTAGVRGTVEFDTPSGGQISVMGLRANAIPNSSGFAVTSLPALANVGAGGGTLAHIVSGGGWQTTVTLVNTGSTAATANLSFIGDAGIPVSLPLSYPQTGAVSTASNLSKSIPAGGSLIVVLQDSGGATTTSGSAILTTTGNIGGFAVFRYDPTGQEAVVPLELVNAPSYILVFDDTGILSTGLAIANVAAKPAVVNVIMRDDTGKQIGTGTISLPAQGHTSFMLTDTSKGGWAFTAGVRGTVEFVTPSGGQIAPLGLRAATIPGGFTITTIPVMTK